MTVLLRQPHWWEGILARSLFAVVGIAIILGGMSVLTVGRSVAEREYDQAVQRLGELLDTVESSASIASFSNDEQLAAEVAQGLMRNGEVLRVVIRTGDVELARAERGPHAKAILNKTFLQGSFQIPSQVKRSLSSPFRQGDVVGEIALDADWSVIDERVQRIAEETVRLLVWQLLLVAAAGAAMMLFLVVRPLKITSDRLHRLDPASGGQLKVPDGHENTELGRLVNDINDLTGHLVATLEQERSLQHQQAIAKRKYQDIFDHAASGIFIAQRDGRIESFNRAFADLTWLINCDDTLQRNLIEPGWRDPGKLLALLHSSLDGTADVVKDDFLLAGRFGDERWLHLAMMPLGDGSVQGTVTDVTQRKNEEISARRMAVVDPLTGFANRAGLEKLLAEIILRVPAFSLVMIDLDGFKQVNDGMGIPAGDQLLMMVSVRIRDWLGSDDSVARIGGDEFVLVVTGDTQRAVVGDRITHLLNELAQPYKVSIPAASQDISISASLGIAVFPGDGGSLHELLRSAELAMGTARTAGGNCYRHYEPAMLAAVEHRRRLEDDLRHALGAGEFQLAFQPIIDLAAGRLVGAEALLRWAHPMRGMVSPEMFIPIAEEMGLIGEIGKMVLREACRQVAEWRADGLDMYVSVNVSARQIPDELPPEAVSRQLEIFGLPTHAIAIEITEGVLMNDVTIAQNWINSLRAAGIRIYLDDFGTGYSSLSYLKRFPMDTVKIDKSFIHDMSADNSDRTLVEAIVTMARSLGLSVVAEGIETQGQFELLQQLGCGYGQGYLFSRPVSGRDFRQVADGINSSFSTAGP